MSLADNVGPQPDALQSTMERTQAAAAANIRSGALFPITSANMPAVVTNSVQSLNSAVAQTKSAIMSGTLTGDMRVSAAIGNLVVAASVVEHLIATFPPHLGVQVDVGG